MQMAWAMVWRGLGQGELAALSYWESLLGFEVLNVRAREKNKRIADNDVYYYWCLFFFRVRIFFFFLFRRGKNRLLLVERLVK